jgi:hypothetical protein
MSRGLLLGAGAVAVVAGFLGLRATRSSSGETLFEPKTKPAQAAPMCPWRNPQSDLSSFFPEATRWEPETHILSGRRIELAQRLGRMPTGDENVLFGYRVYGDDRPLGIVLTRRVKGQSGAIELVLATDTEQRVCGVRLQRLREPESVAHALQDPGWTKLFLGKTANSDWSDTDGFAGIPAEGKGSAEAISDGTRSLLILLAAAEQSRSPASVAEHAH